MNALKKCLGVDLGSNAVKIVEAAVERDTVRILNSASAETLADPAAPVEERRAAIVKTLKDLLKKSKISTKDAVFAMPGQKFFVRRFRLPETTPERLERIIKFEARQQIPFPIDKTYLQYQYSHVPEDREVEVLLVAVRLDEIKDYMKLADRAGLKIRQVTVSSLAVFNAQNFLQLEGEQLAERISQRKKSAEKIAEEEAAKSEAAKAGASGGEAPKKADAKSGAKKGGLNIDAVKGLLDSVPFLSKKKGKPEPEAEQPADAEEDEEKFGDEEEEFIFEEVVAYVNIGATALDLVIAQHGKEAILKFARSVPSAGGNDVTRAIFKQCGVQNFFDAERIKKHQTQLSVFGEGADTAADVNEDASAAASDAVEMRIVSEVRKSLDYFISQPDGMAVDKVILSGGQALMPGMAEFLEDRLTMPVSLVNELPPDSPVTFKGTLPDDFAPFIPALGMAVQGLGISGASVDFLPEDRKITRDFPYTTVAAMAVLLAGVVGLGSQAGLEQAGEYSAEASRARRALEGVQDQINLARNVQNQHNEVADRYERFAQGIGQRDYWLQMLSDIESVKPPGVMVARFDARHDGSVTLGVVVESRVQAADFNSALRDLLEEPREAPELSNPGTHAGAQFGFDAERVFTFTISFRTGDKYNLLRVTPTPDPAAAQRGVLGRPGQQRPGQARPGQPRAPRTGAGGR